MIDAIRKFDRRPPLDAPSTHRFWDDAHIAAGMLQNHLDPAADGATRNRAFVERSADWLASLAPKNARLLDLGCGPGLYAERFCAAGLVVTGVDLSPLSIAHARRSAAQKGLGIEYAEGSYLEMPFEDCFEAAALIYCDYGALDAGSRAKLLQNTHRALAPGGLFVLDVFSPRQYDGRPEQKTWQSADSGFWRPGPYLSLETFYRYDEENAFLQQYIVADGAKVACYNIWDHVFTRETLEAELAAAGFSGFGWYGDIAGAAFDPASPTLCAVCRKGWREFHCSVKADEGLDSYTV